LTENSLGPVYAGVVQDKTVLQIID